MREEPRRAGFSDSGESGGRGQSEGRPGGSLERGTVPWTDSLMHHLLLIPTRHPLRLVTVTLSSV